MQEIEVYIDHNAQLELVGRLTYEQLRGNATYHFMYDAAWLTNHPHLSLVRDWRRVANLCHISPAEQQRFAKRLEYCL